jgi:phosphoribosylanthranilate isomerase
MNERTVKIKVCGMREAANLREIAALRPDFIGLIFYPKSPRFVDFEILGVLPRFENIPRVGVFVNESLENVLRIAEAAKLSFVQLHGEESPEFCARLKNENFQIIKVFGVDANFDGARLRDYEAVCDYFLFDTKTDAHGGSGNSFDWQILRRFPIEKPFFLGGGIGAENVAEAIKNCAGLPLYALDVNSRVEIAPGVKSSAVVSEIMKQIKPQIGLAENPTAAEIKILSAGLSEFTRSQIGGGKHTNLTFFLRDGAGEIVGGVHGNYTDSGWLYVDSLWVSEVFRGGGYGTRLMNEIERAAIENGCRNAYLSTFSFQAPKFYQKLGYSVFGELEDFPAEHRRLFMRKKLI